MQIRFKAGFVFLLFFVMLTRIIWPATVFAEDKSRLSQTELIGYPGESIPLKVIGIQQDIKYRSKNDKIASVTQEGVVLLKTKGRTTIFVDIQYQRLKCKVSVLAPAISSRQIDVYIQKKATLRLSGYEGKVRWRSSDPSIASVSQQGVVTGKSEGSTIIIARAGGIRYKCRVTVMQPENNVENEQLSISVTPQVKNTPTLVAMPSESVNMIGIPVTVPMEQFPDNEEVTVTPVPDVDDERIITPTQMPDVTLNVTITPTTAVPTKVPTATPTVTIVPTATTVPTKVPTAMPTVTIVPTATIAPTKVPAEAPTMTIVPTSTPFPIPANIPPKLDNPSEYFKENPSVHLKDSLTEVVSNYYGKKCGYTYITTMNELKEMTAEVIEQRDYYNFAFFIYTPKGLFNDIASEQKLRTIQYRSTPGDDPDYMNAYYNRGSYLMEQLGYDYQKMCAQGIDMLVIQQFRDEGDYSKYCVWGFADTTAEEFREVKERIEKITPLISNGTDYEKAKRTLEYLCSHINYCKDGRQGQSCYGALVNGNSVCEGYTCAYKLLLDAVGVPCEIVMTRNHAWNIVMLEGAWYVVDVTHCDTKPIQYYKFLLGKDVMYSSETRYVDDAEIEPESLEVYGYMNDSNQCQREISDTSYGHKIK